MELIDKINQATNGEYEFSLKSAKLFEDKNFCEIDITYKDGTLLTLEKKKEICSIMLGIVPQNFEYKFNFIKNFISEEKLKDEFDFFMKSTYPSICYKINFITKEENKFILNINIDTLSYEHACSVNLNKKAEKFFKNKYADFDFEVTLSEDKVFVENAENLIKQNYKEEEIDMYSLRKIEVENKEVFIGEPIDIAASYIKDKERLNGNACFCGTIKNIKSKIIKKPVKKKENKDDKTKTTKAKLANLKEEPAVEEMREKTIFNWTLEGFTGTIQCVYFATKATKAKMSTLEDGASVVIVGVLETNKYTEELNLNVKDISVCSLPEKFEEVIIYHKEKPFYEWVKPEKLVTYKQNDLLGLFNEDKVCPYLAGKTFVCYDLETTGLRFENGDRMIEIGAVKIVDGKIVEQFSSLINPERSIPAEASKVNNIYDSDVVNAPKASQVLQDFYKFTRGAVIIGYNNISFDNMFLIGQGKECRYNFDNPSEDVYKLAQQYVHGVKNYKLGTIAKYLGVVLDNAHRALYDTIATAEVFIKLAENIK